MYLMGKALLWANRGMVIATTIDEYDSVELLSGLGGVVWEQQIYESMWRKQMECPLDAKYRLETLLLGLQIQSTVREG